MVVGVFCYCTELGSCVNKVRTVKQINLHLQRISNLLLGFALIPVFVSGKIVTFTVLVFSFMIYQFYSASIVSFLLSTPARTIKTLEDLLNSHLEAGCEDSLFDRDYFRVSGLKINLNYYFCSFLENHESDSY